MFRRYDNSLNPLNGILGLKLLLELFASKSFAKPQKRYLIKKKFFGYQLTNPHLIDWKGLFLL